MFHMFIGCLSFSSDGLLDSSMRGWCKSGIADLSSANRVLCKYVRRVVGLTYVGCGLSCTIVDNVPDHSLHFIYLQRRFG